MPTLVDYFLADLEDIQGPLVQPPTLITGLKTEAEGMAEISEVAADPVGLSCLQNDLETQRFLSQVNCILSPTHILILVLYYRSEGE
jgi:hypothetical protein